MTNDWLVHSFHCAFQKKFSGSNYTIMLRCARLCPRFPCKSLRDFGPTREALAQHFEKQVTGLQQSGRRRRMYLFRKDGTIREASKDFDPANLNEKDLEELQGVDEVLYVSKRYVPTIKLVPVKEGQEASKGKEKASETSKPANKKRSKKEEAI